MLISFAIHPEKAPKPLNRKSATTVASTSNLHNLNILERESVIGPGSTAAVTAAATPSPSDPAATTMLLSDMVRIEGIYFVGLGISSRSISTSRFQFSSTDCVTVQILCDCASIAKFS